jgi:hypothetical protein
MWQWYQYLTRPPGDGDDILFLLVNIRILFIYWGNVSCIQWIYGGILPCIDHKKYNMSMGRGKNEG